MVSYLDSKAETDAYAVAPLVGSKAYMAAYGTKSKTTKILAEFRHPRFFQDEDVSHLYRDLRVDKDGNPTNLKQYEGTDRDCYLAFKRTKIGSDDKETRDLLYHQDMINWSEYRQALDEGMTANEAEEMYLKDAERTQPVYAKAEYFTRAIQGPYFEMPSTMQNKDVYGDEKVPDGLDPDGLYEYAGKIPPISHEMFEVLDVEILVMYLNYMDVVHGGRSPIQEATFPEGDVPPDDVAPAPVGRRGKGKKPA